MTVEKVSFIKGFWTKITLRVRAERGKIDTVLTLVNTSNSQLKDYFII
jgi:hypothetical protein